MTRERDGITDEPGGQPSGFREGAPPRLPRQEGDEDNPFRQRRGLDATFGNTSTFLVVLLALLVPPVAVVLGLIGAFRCQDALAVRKAWIMAAVASPMTALYIALGVYG